MRAVLVVVLLSVCVAYVASASIVDQRRKELAPGPVNNGQYIAPTPNDCRSPCPALNTLANHGLLPRDGRKINYDMLKHALVGIYNLGDVFGTIFASAATKKFAHPDTQDFNLCDLLINLHHNDQPSGQTGIEHSASLSRQDRPNGDFSHMTDGTQRNPDPVQSNIVLSHAVNGMITVPQFTAARRELWAKSIRAQPALANDPLHKQEAIIADVEGCLFLGALSGNSNGGRFQISDVYARYFLQREQFPPGWAKSPRPLGLPQLFECLTAQAVDWAHTKAEAMAALSVHWFMSFGF